MGALLITTFLVLAAVWILVTTPSRLNRRSKEAMEGVIARLEAELRMEHARLEAKARENFDNDGLAAWGELKRATDPILAEYERVSRIVAADDRPDLELANEFMQDITKKVDRVQDPAIAEFERIRAGHKAKYDEALAAARAELERGLAAIARARQ